MKHKNVIILMVLMISLFLASCSNQYSVQTNSSLNSNDESNSISTINSISTHESNENFFSIDKQTQDVDGDGVDDKVGLFGYKDVNSGSFKIKISINGKESISEIKSSARIDNAEKMKFVNLDDTKKGIFIKLFDSSNEESLSHDYNSPYLHDYSCVVFGYKDNTISLLFDSTSLPFNNENNYEIKYLGNFFVDFTDKSTNFTSKYKVLVDEALVKNYKEGLEKLDELHIPQAMSERNYYDIRVNADNHNEIICSKYIPGLYHNDVLGVIDYSFSFNNSKNTYALARESLWYNKVLNMPLIKEKIIVE